MEQRNVVLLLFANKHLIFTPFKLNYFSVQM